MEAFAGEADMIEHDVREQDSAYFSNRTTRMLRDAGLTPGDDDPCDLPVSDG